jgi:hypothetical protein
VEAPRFRPLVDELVEKARRDAAERISEDNKGVVSSRLFGERRLGQPFAKATEKRKVEQAFLGMDE